MRHAYIMFREPSVAEVSTAIPHFPVSSYIAKGTFKAAYTGDGALANEALKLFYVPHFEDTDEGRNGRAAFLGRFERELRLLGKCISPSLVKLGTLECEDAMIEGVHFKAYSEELLVGSNLKSLIEQSHRPSEAEIIELLRSLADAIRELWTSHGAVHRDIKPGNVVRVDGPPMRFVLLDLGISFETGGAKFTFAPISPGTPLYYAPEMLDINYADLLDARTDLYCAGVTVFEYASGQHPLGLPNRGTLEAWIRTQPPVRLESLRPDLSPKLCALINRLNRKRPSLRGSLDLALQELSSF
jgi:serine/threonine protein kinase